MHTSGFLLLSVDDVGLWLGRQAPETCVAGNGTTTPSTGGAPGLSWSYSTIRGTFVQWRMIWGLAATAEVAAGAGVCAATSVAIAVAAVTVALLVGIAAAGIRQMVR